MSGKELAQLGRKAEAPRAIQLWEDTAMLRNQSRPRNRSDLALFRHRPRPLNRTEEGLVDHGLEVLERAQTSSVSPHGVHQAFPHLTESGAIAETDELIYGVASATPRPKVIKMNVAHNSAEYALSMGKCVFAVNGAFGNLVSLGLTLDVATRVCDRKNAGYNWRACAGGVNSGVADLAAATSNLAYAPAFCGVMDIIDSWCGGDWAWWASSTISTVGNAFSESVDCVPPHSARRRRLPPCRSCVREISDSAQKLPPNADEATFMRWWSSVTRASSERQERQVTNASAGRSRARPDAMAKTGGGGAPTVAGRRLKTPWQTLVNRALGCANTARGMANVIGSVLFGTWSTIRSCKGDLIPENKAHCAALFVALASALPRLTDRVSSLVATCPKKSFPRAGCASEVADQADDLMSIGAAGAAISTDCRGEPGWPAA